MTWTFWTSIRTFESTFLLSYSAGLSLIWLNGGHPLGIDPNIVLSIYMEVHPSHAWAIIIRHGEPPDYIAIHCYWNTPIVHHWFERWKLPSVEQLSLFGFMYGMALA